nr:hypothetical protein [Chlamydiota bacterium]
ELGGHIALEMLHKAAPISKLMLVSTVPIEFSAQGISKGYKLNRRDYELLQKDTFSKVEAAEYLEDLNKTWMVDAAMKVDSKMRPQLFQSMKDGRSEIATVQEHSDKIHLIFGQKDRKWDFGHVTAIRGTTPLTSIEGGINTPWTNSEIFNEALSMFLEQ